MDNALWSPIEEAVAPACAPDDDRRDARGEAGGAVAPLDIRLVVDADDYHAAADLLERRYRSRGYAFSLPEPLPLEGGMTLLARIGEHPVGTISVGFDGPRGLLCDAVFGQEVNALRGSGLRLCEFTKLAVEDGARSRQVLASLFSHAFAHAHRVRRADQVLVEVNPRHVGAYVRMLGFRVMGEERHNPRVDAPGVLLGLDLTYANRNLHGRSERPMPGESTRSFYRHMRAAGVPG